MREIDGLIPARRGKMILTAKVGKNSDVFCDILNLYGDAPIVDITFGRGNFWNGCPELLESVEKSDITTGTDFRNLPYSSDTKKTVVFDPPYMYNPKATVKKSISSTYNLNNSTSTRTNDDVLSLYRQGIIESYRVLQENGILILKCQDTIESGRPKWNHISIFNMAINVGFKAEDLFVLVQTSQPTIRWTNQKHARKNHSYFWVFRKIKPFFREGEK